MILDERLHDLLDELESADSQALSGSFSEADSNLIVEAKAVANRLALADRLLGIDAEPPVPAIPGYEIHEYIAGGGMGDVWRATQLATRRIVALKLMRQVGHSSRRAQSRFEREVELASRLEHPNIARVYDSGIHQNQFFYAMELIEGIPLDHYVSGRRISRDSTLRLVIAVCHALQRAHQLGVIHRDLKPSNILVTADGQPHIVDFGLAKEVWNDQSPTITQESILPGTPAYMSPEQASGDAMRVGTASDVYSLGVILFQLLLKQLPHDTSGSSLQILQRIASLPSAIPRAIDRNLDRDLEAILLKALSREQADRYTSTEAFAADIGRFLRSEPIIARRRTPSYVATKFIGRNRYKVIAAVASAALLTGVSAFAYLRIQRQRDRADVESAIALATNQFLSEIITSTDPVNAQGEVPTLPELLDRAASRVEKTFAGRPLQIAAVSEAIGRTYQGLGRNREAEPHYVRALQCYREVLGSDDARTILAELPVAQMDIAFGRFADGERRFRELAERSTRLFERTSEVSLKVRHELAGFLMIQMKYDEWAEVLRSLADDQRKAGKSELDIRGTEALLAFARAQLDSNNDSEPACRIAYDRMLAAVGERHPATLTALNNLAIALFQNGKQADAESLAKRGAELRKQVFGEDHESSAFGYHTLGLIEDGGNHLADAEIAYRESLRINRAALGDDSIAVLNDACALFLLTHQQGRLREAEEYIDICRRQLPTKVANATPDFDAIWVSGYAETLAMADLHDEALAILERAAPIAIAHLPPDSAGRVRMLKSLNAIRSAASAKEVSPTTRPAD